MTKRLLCITTLIVCNFIALCGYAGIIKGKVADAATNDQLIGASVMIKETHVGTVSNLDGSYQLKNVNPGTYTLVCKYIGYKPIERSVTVTGDVLIADFSLESTEGALDEVVIKADANKESDVAARKSEQISDNVINVISANTIDLSPDITVANVLRRMSGVSIQSSSNGEAQYAVIRGMDKRYSYTLIDGIKIPSPDNNNRYIPMDIFPSDLLQKLEVDKSLTPDMEADATGGVMNLVMKEAPEQMTIHANVGFGASQSLFDQGYQGFDRHAINFSSPNQLGQIQSIGGQLQELLTPGSIFSWGNVGFHDYKGTPLNSLANFSIGRRFLKNKLGFILAASYTNTYSGSTSTFFVPNSQPSPGAEGGQGNIPVFSDLQLRQYSTQQTRLGSHAALDYKLNSANKLTLSATAIQLTDVQSRYVDDSVLAVQRQGPGSGDVTQKYRTQLQVQTIYNITLRGEHALSEHLHANWALAYSEADNKMPDRAEYSVDHAVYFDSTHKQVATPLTLSSISRIWQSNTDKDKAGYANFIYDNKLFGKKIIITAGGMFRNKVRDNFYDDYSIDPLLGQNQLTQNFTTISNAMWGAVKPNNGNDGVNNYHIAENIYAYYLEAKVLLTKQWEVLGGARLESTYTYWDAPQLSSETVALTGAINYYDLLPSGHVMYKIDKKQALRLSYYESVTRPGFYEYVPYSIPGEYYTQIGNPDLKHSVADNLDLRYELFGKGVDQLMAGVFYKDIQNPIEYAYVRTGISAAALQPNNFGNAQNYGFEFLGTKFIQKFGVSANYTFTESQITTPKIYYYTNSSGYITNETLNQTRPMQGQAKNIANISLIYKDTKNGLNAQVSYVYTGKRIQQLSLYYDLDYWQRSTSVLDFSLEKTINKHFSAYCKVNNILNTPNIVDIQQSNPYTTGKAIIPDQTSTKYITVEKDYYKQTYLVGIKYKF